MLGQNHLTQAQGRPCRQQEGLSQLALRELFSLMQSHQALSILEGVHVTLQGPEAGGCSARRHLLLLSVEEGSTRLPLCGLGQPKWGHNFAPYLLSALTVQARVGGGGPRVATAPCCDCLEVSVCPGDMAGSVSEGKGSLHGIPSVLHVADPLGPGREACQPESQNLTGVPRKVNAPRRGVVLDFLLSPNKARLTHDNKILSSDTEQYVATGVPCPRVMGGEGARPDGCTGRSRENLGSVRIGPSHRLEPVSAETQVAEAWPAGSGPLRWAPCSDLGAQHAGRAAPGLEMLEPSAILKKPTPSERELSAGVAGQGCRPVRLGEEVNAQTLVSLLPVHAWPSQSKEL